MEKKHGGQPGNKNAVAVKDPEMLPIIFKSYCEHIASGVPKYGWYYRDAAGNRCGWEAMDSYIDQGLVDLAELQEAYSLSFKKWFNRGERLVDGEIKNGSPKTWETIMRNKFRKKCGWDEDVGEQDKKDIKLTITNFSDEPKD